MTTSLSVASTESGRLYRHLKIINTLYQVTIPSFSQKKENSTLNHTEFSVGGFPPGAE